MDTTIFDVAIIGGGQAGLTLALQLVQKSPEIKVLVLERNTHPLPAAAHKVGESVVEISSIYMNHVLGLDELLARETRKFGLRFFFSDDTNSKIERRFELGASHYLTVPSFHIDRGSFETALALKCQQSGIEFMDGCRVLNVQLGKGNQTHQLNVRHLESENQQTIPCRWVIDAAARTSPLKRQLQLALDNRHNVNAAWFRIDHAFELDDWCASPDWKNRVQESRRLSTNHLMGEGYWLWFIPLANGRTSIGIVAENRRHPFKEINTLEKAIDWIARHEPQSAAKIKPQLNKLMDFMCLRHYSHNAQQVFSSDRWCLTGEAGVFLDPFYSPGGDFIGIGNDFICELISRQRKGEDISVLASEYDDLYQRLYRIFLSIYHRQYPLMGNTRVMSLKVIWDFSVYWGCVALIFCNRKIYDLEFIQRIEKVLFEFGFATIVMQKFFRDWAKQDDNPALSGFLDYAEITFLARLNADLLKDFDDDDHLFAQLQENLKLIQEIQQEIMSRAGKRIPELAPGVESKSSHLRNLFPLLEM